MDLGDTGRVWASVWSSSTLRGPSRLGQPELSAYVHILMEIQEDVNHNYAEWNLPLKVRVFVLQANHIKNT